MLRVLYTAWISNSEKVPYSVDDTRLIFANHLQLVHHLHDGPFRPSCKIKGQTGLTVNILLLCYSSGRFNSGANISLRFFFFYSIVQTDESIVPILTLDNATQTEKELNR